MMKDPTFVNYTGAQAIEYNRHRRPYPPALIGHIIEHHKRSGGLLSASLDIGCGPGTATRDIAQHFDHAAGVDPSQEMVRVAQSVGGTTKTGESIQYFHAAAEEIDQISSIPTQSVDLLTAAMSAHWFDMPRFWPAAARVLRPGGTVALFTLYRIYCHPMKTPRSAEVQACLMDLENNVLKDYHLPPNRLVMQGYSDLELPWMVKDESFDPESFARKVWNENGTPDADVEGGYFAGEVTLSIDDEKKAFETTSAVTRWRAANPDLAFTERDCVEVAFRKIRGILGPHVNEINMVARVVLLMLRKR